MRGANRVFCFDFDVRNNQAYRGPGSTGSSEETFDRTKLTDPDTFACEINGLGVCPEFGLVSDFKSLKRLVKLSGREAGQDFYGEFDPGSGLTLAACLTHASRTR